MKVMCKTVSAIILTLVVSFQTYAADIVGGTGSAAEKLILSWASAKTGNRANTIKFSSSISSNDLTMLRNGKIDFAILDAPISDSDLVKMNLLQFPFALSGVAIVVNLPNTMAGILKLDSDTVGKIFSGEIKNWDDPAIVKLNPRHDLPNKEIIIVHSGESSSDYPVFNGYIGEINEKWKSGDGSGIKREWPSNSIYTHDIDSRITTIKTTSFSIGYMPMQYLPRSALTTAHIKNRDGFFNGLSDTSIIASTSKVNIEVEHAASLSLINKSGNTSWPITNFSFIVVKKDRVKDDKIVQLLGVIQYGLKYGSLKTTIQNYVPIPENISKSILAKIETLADGSNTGTAGKAPPAKTSQEAAQEALANQKNNEEELNRQRADENSAAQTENHKAEEKNRTAKLQADNLAREQAIKEAKAAKLAAEEAMRAALKAKQEAEQIAEKNRLFAKAEKEKADKEKAEKERIEKEKAEKEKAIRLRNQKDEDPLEAYRRSQSK